MFDDEDVDEVVQTFLGKIFEYLNESEHFIKSVNLRCSIHLDSVSYKCRSKDDYLQKCSHFGKLFNRYCHRVANGVPISYFAYTPCNGYLRSDLMPRGGVVCADTDAGTGTVETSAGVDAVATAGSTADINGTAHITGGTYTDRPFTIVLTCAPNIITSNITTAAAATTTPVKQKWGITSVNYVIEHGIQVPPDDPSYAYLLNTHDILQKFVQYHSSDLESCMSTDHIDHRDNVSSFVNLKSDMAPPVATATTEKTTTRTWTAGKKRNGNMPNVINSSVFAYSMADMVTYFKAHGDANPPSADYFAPPKHNAIFGYR